MHVYAPDEYRNMRMFVTPDSLAGFALKADGDIVSAFKHDDSKAKKAAESLLALATQQGGRKLDAFDTVLPRIYSDSGFRAVARLKWSDQYAPDGWSYETFKKFNAGRPDVVFMVYDPEHAQAYKPGDGAYVDDYDAGVAAQAAALAKLTNKTWDESKHPRDPAGTSTGGQFTSGEGGAAQGELFPELPPLPAPKTKIEVRDFHENEVRLDTETRTDEEKAQKFLEHWNGVIREAPAEFKKHFLGGLGGTMSVEYRDYDDSITMSGKLTDADGATIGEYTRSIDFKNNKASSDYFVLRGSNKGGGIGKTLLASNVRMYQRLGLDKVEVHANIDVGGYAWAKYGYVPTRESWRDLSGEIEEKINELAGGTGYAPGSWDEMTSDQQEEAFRKYADYTHDDYYTSEVDNWHESGQALDQAKTNIANAFHATSPWATDALDAWRQKRTADQPEVPFNNDVIMNAITLDYDSRRGDGTDDPEINFDDKALPEGQADKLTEEVRDEITDVLTKAFNKLGEDDASSLDPPDYIGDNIRDFQQESWDSMRDRDRFEFAEGHMNLSGYSEGTGEMDESDADYLRELVQDGDPKAIWAIADSEWGKELLLGTDWNGEIRFDDKESMDRFNAYVGKKSKPKAA